jgi:hypothetical protein
MKNDLTHQIVTGVFVPPVAVTPTVLAALWKQRVGELFPAESVALKTREMGQLGTLIRKLGPDRALSAVAFALSNWAAFRYAVNMELTGVAVASKTPSIGTVLRHRDLLLAMMGAA